LHFYSRHIFFSFTLVLKVILFHNTVDPPDKMCLRFQFWRLFKKPKNATDHLCYYPKVLKKF
jgi:hypothetical protein